MRNEQLVRETTEARRARYLEGAARYARATPSDPFAFARARTHIAMGLCDPDFDGKGNVREGFYNALANVNVDTGRVAWSQIKRL